MPKISADDVRRSIAEGTGKMGLNTQLAGKRYDASVVTVTDEAIRNYAAATNEDNSAFTGAEPFAPPAFPIVPAAAAIASVMFDQELGVNLPLLVHGEEDHLFHAPIRAGDQLTVQSILESVELKETGETFTILTTLTRPDDELVAEVRSLMFIRGSGSGSGSKAPSAPAPDRAEPVFQTVQKIDDDQTYRYAEASGDHNLIHMDPDFAVNMAGLPGIIVHGMCTMAFAGKAVLDAVAGGDPKRLRRIKVRFSKPVFPGQTITTQGWLTSKADGVSTFDFETINPDGVPVIRNGVAEVVD